MQSHGHQVKEAYVHPDMRRMPIIYATHPKNVLLMPLQGSYPVD